MGNECCTPQKGSALEGVASLADRCIPSSIVTMQVLPGSAAHRTDSGSSSPRTNGHTASVFSPRTVALVSTPRELGWTSLAEDGQVSTVSGAEMRMAGQHLASESRSSSLWHHPDLLLSSPIAPSPLRASSLSSNGLNSPDVLASRVSNTEQNAHRRNLCAHLPSQKCVASSNITRQHPQPSRSPPAPAASHLGLTFTPSQPDRSLCSSQGATMSPVTEKKEKQQHLARMRKAMFEEQRDVHANNAFRKEFHDKTEATKTEQNMKSKWVRTVEFNARYYEHMKSIRHHSLPPIHYKAGRNKTLVQENAPDYPVYGAGHAEGCSCQACNRFQPHLHAAGFIVKQIPISLLQTPTLMPVGGLQRSDRA